MKKYIFLFLAFPFCANASDCKYGNIEDFGVFWIKFRKAIILSDVTLATQLSEFPITLTDLQSPNKNLLKLNKSTTSTHFREIFIENPPGQPVYSFSALNNSTDKSYESSKIYTDTQGCFDSRIVKYGLNVNGYKFVLGSNGQWKFSSMDYSTTDFENLKFVIKKRGDQF